MILIVVDLEHQIIPDEVQIALALLSIPYAYFWEKELSTMLFTALGMGLFSYGLRSVFWLWKKKEGLGMGDVKFFIVCGLYLSPYGLAPFLLYAGISGVVLGLIWQRLGFGERFPFGPSLALAFFVCIAFPEWHDALFIFTPTLP
jgi:prepilin signal peptidase PulO-like enzyme (type II secretory pathway)